MENLHVGIAFPKTNYFTRVERICQEAKQVRLFNANRAKFKNFSSLRDIISLPKL